MNERISKAVDHYLALKGMDVIGKADDYVFFDDTGQLVCAWVVAKQGFFPPNEEELDRREAEQVMFDYINDHDEYLDTSVRLDVINFMCASDRAFVRHAVNV